MDHTGTDVAPRGTLRFAGHVATLAALAAATVAADRVLGTNPTALIATEAVLLAAATAALSGLDRLSRPASRPRRPDEVTRLPAVTPAPAARVTRSRRVLLVEGTARDRERVCRILEAEGHVVDIVGDGAEAVMAVLDADYDVVLMDPRTPGLGGLAATRMIRALHHPCRDVPIVGMVDATPDKTAAREAGMTEVIQRPFSAAEILAAVDRIGRFLFADGEPMGPGDHDTAILAKLAGLLGDAKIRVLLHGLAASLAGRFTADPETPAGRAELRRQAQASVAGSGMLGFTGFSVRCKAFQGAPDDGGFARRFGDLRCEAAVVAAVATRLAEQAAPLAPASAA